MKKSNKFLDGPKVGMPTSVWDIVLLPFLFMLVMSIGFGIVDLVVQGLYSVGVVKVDRFNNYYYYIQLIGGFGLGILVLFLFVQKTGKRSIKTLGFYKEKAITYYLSGVGLALVGILGIIMMLQKTGSIEVTLQKMQLSIHTILLGSVILMAWILQGAAEEVLVRGYLLPTIAAKTDMITGVIVSSIAFALMHIGNNGVSMIGLMNILLCGVMLALLAIRQESLWGVCGFHTMWNLLQGNVFGIAVSGNGEMPSIWKTTYEEPSYWNGGLFGIEGSILTTIFMIISIIILVRLLNKEI
ncbi:MAG: type II CAAX endopeptidase family protein [Cellulosilyticaceae bacterium]